MLKFRKIRTGYILLCSLAFVLLTAFCCTCSVKVSASVPGENGEAVGPDENAVYEDGKLTGKTDFYMIVENPTHETEPEPEPEPKPKPGPEPKPTIPPEPEPGPEPEPQPEPQPGPEPQPEPVTPPVTPTQPDKKENLPKTGDYGPSPELYLILALICGAGYLVTSLIERKHG